MPAKSKIKFSPLKAKWGSLMILLTLASSLFMFAGGTFSPETVIEIAANDIASFSQVNKDNKPPVSILFGETGNDRLSPVAPIYNYWRSIFRNSKFNFLGLISVNQQNESYFTDYPEYHDLSFVYAETFSNRSPETGKYDYWRHEYYDYYLMFQGAHTISSGAFSFCYITKSQADTILKSQGITIPDVDASAEISADQTFDIYKSLIGTNLSITINEDIYKWTIADIILETGDLFTNTTALLGNWILTSARTPSGYFKQHCFIFNEFTFQNAFKIKYFRNNYLPFDFDITTNLENLDDPQTMHLWDETIAALHTDYDYHLVFEIFLMLISVALITVAFFFVQAKGDLKGWRLNLVASISYLFSFTFFFLINLITKSAYFFSKIALIGNLLCMVLAIIISWLFELFKNKQNERTSIKI